jgi:hypothetical protein
MIVKYLGGNCFQLREKDSYLLLGEPASQVDVDVVLLGNGKQLVKKLVSPKKRKQPFFVPGPGEYEIGGIEIFGQGDHVWQINFNKWQLCFMNQSWQMPDEKKVDALGQIDILFLTLLKGKTGAKKAAEAIKRVSPKAVIPGINRKDQDKDWAKAFLDEMDKEDLKPKEKLTLKKSQLSEETTDIYLLKSKE